MVLPINGEDMTTTWGKDHNRPRPGFGTRWVVVVEGAVVETFDHKHDAVVHAQGIPGSTVEQRRNVLSLGTGSAREGKIGF
jgi:hypothetical protein